MNKKIILLIILIISIFMIGAVSATTNNTDKVSTKLTDKTSNKKIIVKKDNTIKEDVFSKNKKDKLGITYTGNFNELSKDINNVKEGETLNLTKNYKYTKGSIEGIPITKSITINGNGHTLDGNNQSRIFKVTRGVHIILKNLNLYNGKGPEYKFMTPEDDTTLIEYYSVGGAIYAEDCNVTITNCNFTNNNVDGVICAYNVNITNCNFTNNNGTTINAYNKVATTNCNFTNNKGYAISAGDVTATNCNFINNNYRAISANDVTATNCNFTNNKDNAINVYNKATATNCVFTNNTYGAISSAFKVNATNCNFTNNKILYEGGAIDAGEVTATNCNFINNEAKQGGAIDATTKLDLTNCLFTNNIAKYGGAIYTDNCNDEVTITNCTFNKNTATNGGAIYIGDDIDIKIINSRFVNNKAKKNTNSSGIYIAEYNSNLLIKKTTFKDDSVYCEFLCNLKLINTQVKVYKKSCINVTPNIIEFGSNTHIIFKSNKKYNIGIYVDGKETIYKATTSINKNIKNLQAGKHTIDIKIFKYNTYNGKSYKYSKTFKIKVTKAKTKITAKPQTYQAQIKTKKYKITLKNKQNKPIKTAKVTLKIGKKTYPSRTNTKGVAIFKITKLTKKGKYTATITYKGDKNYKKSTKKIKLTFK